MSSTVSAYHPAFGAGPMDVNITDIIGETAGSILGKRRRSGSTTVTSNKRPHQVGGHINRLNGCATVGGRWHPLNRQRVLDSLLNSDRFAFQSLNTTDNAPSSVQYRDKGFLFLNSRWEAGGGDTTFPRTADLPVYVFRCSVPNGKLSCAAGYSGGTNEMRPIIAYRLKAIQQSATSITMFRWDPVSTLGTNISTSGVSGNNVQFSIRRDSDPPSVNCQSLYHEWTRADVLFSGAKNVASDVRVSLVKFTHSDFAPPDQYAEGGNTIQTYRWNGGYSTIVSPPPPAEDAMSQYFGRWVHNKLGHPLVKVQDAGNAQYRFPFRTVRSWGMTIRPRVNITTDTGSIQHRHTHTEKVYRWMNVADVGIPPTATVSNGFGPQAGADNLSTQVRIQDNYRAGLFEHPTKQLWVMVQGWTRDGIKASTVQNDTTQDPSFDIRIESSYKYVRDSVSPYGAVGPMAAPQVELPLLTPVVEQIDEEGIGV